MSNSKNQVPGLTDLLQKLGVSQKTLADCCGVSPAAISALCRHSQWPKTGAKDLRDGVVAVLRAMDANAVQINFAMPALPKMTKATKNRAPRTVRAGGSESPSAKRTLFPNQFTKKEDLMLLAKQTLTQEAKQQFKLFRDPFMDDMEDAKDVFLTPDIRKVREAMWATVRHGGILAAVSESGGGKSTIVLDLVDRIQRERANVVVITPYVLAMEESDAKGKTLKSAHIAEAIITAVNPLERPKRSPQARFAQLHQLLKDSHRSGNKHVLIIEEAHCLPTATLKHLKRFFELQDGFKKLLSIILVGQPELRAKLSEKNPEVREVVQRCEVVELPPLDSHLAAYVDFKLGRVGVKTLDVMHKDAIDALRTKLTFASPVVGRSRAFGQAAQTSLLYPLAVANVLCAAMNEAARMGAPLITADIVKEC